MRVDAGIEPGDEVTVHYDPMLAKLIVYAENRPAAIERLRWALDRFAVLGVATNTALLRAIAADPDYQAGRHQHRLPGDAHISRAGDAATAATIALAAAALWDTLAAGAPESARRGPFNPWRAGSAPAAGGERVTRIRSR